MTGVKSLLKETAKQAGVNASEEVLTEAANIAFDTLFMGDVSNWQLSIKGYMAQGMSEAEARRQTAMDMAGQVVEAGMSGGLMGFGFGSIGPVERAIGDRVKRFQQIWDEVNRTVETSTGEGRGRKEVEIRLADPEGRGYNDRREPPLRDNGWNERENPRMDEEDNAQTQDADGQDTQIEGNATTEFNIEKIRPQLKTESGTAFFWSGKTEGIGGADIAADIAKGKGGTTLETTIDSKGITMPEWDLSDPASMDAWDMASAAYAEQVSGEVRAVIGRDLRPGNIWENIELPRLMENPNVTKITIIDPKTGEETVIFER